MKSEVEAARGRPAVAVIPIRDGQVFMSCRLPEAEGFVGRWQVVGGKRERGEKLRETALREVLEETGVLVMPESLVWLGAETHVGSTGREFTLGYYLWNVGPDVMLLQTEPKMQTRWEPIDCSSVDKLPVLSGLRGRIATQAIQLWPQVVEGDLAEEERAVFDARLDSASVVERACPACGGVAVSKLEGDVARAGCEACGREWSVTVEAVRGDPRFQAAGGRAAGVAMLAAIEMLKGHPGHPDRPEARASFKVLIDNALAQQSCPVCGELARAALSTETVHARCLRCRRTAEITLEEVRREFPRANGEKPEYRGAHGSLVEVAMMAALARLRTKPGPRTPQAPGTGVVGIDVGARRAARAR